MKGILLSILLFATLWTTVSAGWMQQNNYRGSPNSVNFERNFEAYRRVQDRIPRSSSKRQKLDPVAEEAANHVYEKYYKEECKICQMTTDMSTYREMLKIRFLRDQEDVHHMIFEWLSRIKLHDSRFIDTMAECKKNISELFDRLIIAKKKGTLRVRDQLLPLPGVGMSIMMADSEFKKKFEMMMEIFKDPGNQTSNGSSISKSSFYQLKSGNFEHQNSIDESILNEFDVSTHLVNNRKSTRLEDAESAGKQYTLGEGMATSQPDEQSSPPDDANTKTADNHESKPEENDVITTADNVDY